jgi:hypothetical protein
LAKRELAAVELHEVSDDSQAEPRAARLLAPLLPDIENHIPCLGRQPRAIVRDNDPDFARRPILRKPYRQARCQLRSSRGSRFRILEIALRSGKYWMRYRALLGQRSGNLN